MALNSAAWRSNSDLPVGKGETLQQFFATVGKDRYEINVAPWGEGQLTINGREIARTADAKDRRQAFASLKQAAERYIRGEPVDLTGNGKIRLIPAVKAKLLAGKKGLVVGIANERSIAWGCAAAFRAFGADLAITYLNDKAKKYIDPLARELESKIVMPLDVRVPGQMEAVFERISKEWGRLDFVVHSIAFSPKDALHGRVVDVPLEGFPDDDGSLLLDIPANGAPCGAVDEEGWHALHHDLLRQPDRREKLQRYGSGEGGAGERR